MSITPIVWRRKDKIVIGERDFNGIETTYDAIVGNLSPDDARYIATELWKLAEAIDGKAEKESKLKIVRENTDKIIAEEKQRWDVV